MSYPPTEAGNISNDSLFSDSMDFDAAEKPGHGAGAIDDGATPDHRTRAVNPDFGYQNERSYGSDSPSKSHLEPEPEMAAPPAVGAFMKPRRTALPQPKEWQPLALRVPADDPEDEFDIATAKQPVFRTVADPTPKVVFENGEPDMRGDITNCFEEPGLLYRIVDRKAKTWAFYNDSLAFEVQVVCTFGKHSKIEALDNTRLTRNTAGEYIATVTVYPGETEMFIKGFVNGFTSKLRAVPLSDEYFSTRSAAQTDSVIQSEIDAIREIAGDETDAEVVLQVCLANNLPFVDLSFPPLQSSIDKGAAKPFKQLPWARPSMYVNPALRDQIRLFRNGVTPGDVDQGELGDCWLMCALATHAEDPKAVMDMFRHPRGPEYGRSERALGAYRVTFNKNGLWRSIIVDDYLPVVASSPKFARSSDPCELWPAILEKAFAKLHGSYAMIQSGDPVHALTDLTGCPSMRFDDRFTEAAHSNSKGDELFNEWIEWTRGGYQVIITTAGKAPAIVPGSHNVPDFSEEPELERALGNTGFLPGHAYTVLAAKEVAGHKLVHIRNPWPHGDEWCGDWSRTSPMWTSYPKVAQRVGFKGERAPDDGTVWMSWQDVHHYFNGGGVTFKSRNKAEFDYRVPFTFLDTKPSVVFEVAVKQPMRVCISLANIDHRCLPGTSADADPDSVEYPPIMLSVCTPVEKGEDVYNVTLNTAADTMAPSDSKWTFLQAREISMMVDLEPRSCPYMIIPRLMDANGGAADALDVNALNPIHFINNYSRAWPDGAVAVEKPEVPVVFGLRCEMQLDTTSNVVIIRRMDGGNAVFENFPKFPTDGEVSDVQEMYFQTKEPDCGFADEKMGNALC